MLGHPQPCCLINKNNALPGAASASFVFSNNTTIVTLLRWPSAAAAAAAEAAAATATEAAAIVTIPLNPEQQFPSDECSLHKLKAAALYR